MEEDEAVRDYRYENCVRCGERWNVAKQWEGKSYLCPRCRGPHPPVVPIKKKGEREDEQAGED